MKSFISKRRMNEAVSKDDMETSIGILKDETRFNFEFVEGEDYWKITDPKSKSKFTGWDIAHKLASVLGMKLEKFYDEYEIVVFDDHVEMGTGLFYVDENGEVKVRDFSNWDNVTQDLKQDTTFTKKDTNVDDIVELEPNADYHQITDVLDGTSLEDFCKQLDFLVKSSDTKSKMLFDTFKKGWKKEYGKIEVVSGYISIRDLHPTQNVIYADKSLGKILNGKWKIDGYEFAVDALLSEQSPSITMGDPLVVCEVGGVYYLIDGHHRWSKAYSFNPNCKMYAHLIKNSDKIFATADDVLKFAQGTLTAMRNTSPINNQQLETDFNMYNMTIQNLRSILIKNLTKQVFSRIVNEPLVKGVIKNVGGLCTYLWANINVMKHYAPAGIHDRVFMPQYPEGDTNPSNAVARIAAESRRRKNMKKMNENKKISLTLNQLKRLVNESRRNRKRIVNEGPGAGYTIKLTNCEAKQVNVDKLSGDSWKVYMVFTHDGSAEGYDWYYENDRNHEFTSELEFTVTRSKIESLADYCNNTIDDAAIENMLNNLGISGYSEYNITLGGSFSHCDMGETNDVQICLENLADDYDGGICGEIVDIDDDGYGSRQIDGYIKGRIIFDSGFVNSVNYTYKHKDDEQEGFEVEDEY